jgi:hypothetical protein
MRKLLISFLLLALPASATTFYVNASTGSSGNTCTQAQSTSTPKDTIAHGIACMGTADTVVVYAGTYSETPSVPAGAGSGSYNTVTVNGSDVVTVNGSFTLGSHVKLIGNCPAFQGALITATCGFFVQSLAGGGGACLTIGSSVTDTFVVDNAFYACGGSGQIEIAQSATFIYIQGNTLSYAGTTKPNANQNEFHNINTNGNHVLIEGNDLSHYGLGIMFQGEYTIIRNNSFHDQFETEAGSNHHTDAIFTEPWEDGLSSGDNQFAVIEGNTHTNAVGANAKGFLFQADSCSGSPCNHAIVRFNAGSHIGSTYTTDDNSFSSVPGWSYVKEYNNTWVDIHMTTGTGGSTYTNYYMSHSTNPADLNGIFYFPGAVSSYNPYASDSTTDATFTYGHALLYCGGGCSNIFGHLYNSGSWLSDPGNVIADPLFVNYSALNFHLQSGSPAIAAGTYLTTVASGDSGSGTSLVVTDASYFQDGYGLANANSTVSPDCISVTTVTNHICIASGGVNYSTNTITMASGFSRSVGDSIWLYSKSDGAHVLTGSAPDMGAFPFSNGASFTCSPTTVPANHSGNITETCTGTSTSWTGSTSFSLSGVSGVTLVSSTNNSSTSQTLVITTGSSTGTETISDTTDSISTTITVATATLSVSPTSGNTSTTPSVTLTGANTLWSSETASTLFSVSGGSGASLGTPSVSSNTSATVTLTVGSAAGALTLTDNSTTATTTFTATSPSTNVPSGNGILLMSENFLDEALRVLALP